MDDATALLARREIAVQSLERVLRAGKTGYSAGDRSVSLMSPSELRAEIEAIDRQLAALDRGPNVGTSYVRLRRGR